MRARKRPDFGAFFASKSAAKAGGSARSNRKKAALKTVITGFRAGLPIRAAEVRQGATVLLGFSHISEGDGVRTRNHRIDSPVL
jgi:hypothetical protein